MERCIFWTMHENIGDLAPIYMELQGQTPSRESEGLRCNIKEILGQFRKEGFHNIAMDSRQPTSSAIDLLEHTGLMDSFELVYGEECVGDDDINGVFDYSVLAKSMKISLEELVHSSVVFGTALDDQPKNSRGMVFIQHQDAYKYDAWVAKCIMDKLTYEKDLQKGFDDLYHKGFIVPARSDFFSGHRMVNISSGIIASLGYVKNTCCRDGIPIPTIDCIKAETYLRGLKKIE